MAPTQQQQLRQKTASMYTRRIPHNFFDKVSGKGPSDPEEAKKYWEFRKNKPRDSVDNEDPDGEQMVLEIKEMRKKLQQHILKQYNARVLEIAQEVNLNNELNQLPKKREDVQKNLLLLKPTDYRVVYEVFYARFTRQWNALQIDAWCDEENIVIVLPKVGDDSKSRVYSSDRGGFSTVARDAVNQARKYYINCLWTKKQWKVEKTKPNGIELVKGVDEYSLNGTTFHRFKIGKNPVWVYINDQSDSAFTGKRKVREL